MVSVKNNDGSVLVATLAFVLVFMLLGVASTHSVLVQNHIAEKEKASAEAFWMADGGIEKAAQNLSQSLSNMTNETVSIGRGSYDLATVPVCICNPSQTCTPETCTGSNGFLSSSNRKINSVGTVTIHNDIIPDADMVRRIEAKYGTYDIENAITTHGEVNGDCHADSPAFINGNCVYHEQYSFETVFNGMSYPTDFDPIATSYGQYFTILNSSTPFTVSDLTILKYSGGSANKLSFNIDDDTVYVANTPAFLIVDTTGYTGVPTSYFEIKGNTDTFCGIIWVIGEMKFAGTPLVNGAIFIDGEDSFDAYFGGNAITTFNLPCVEQAVGFLGSGLGSPNFYAWNEY